jgi:signal transduction histidine kinase
MRARLFEPLQLGVVIVVSILLLALAVLGWLNVRAQERLRVVSAAFAQIQELQRVGLQMTRLMSDDVAAIAPVTRDKVAAVARELDALEPMPSALHRQTSARLAKAYELLADPNRDPRVATARALGMMRQATYEETSAGARLLGELQSNTKAETRLALAALLLLPLVLLLAVWLLRERILEPINDLKGLLLRIAEGDVAPVQSTGEGRYVRQLFENYNHMVERLHQLERQRGLRAASLESEVRAATAAILEQQAALARAERLAAVGELSASLAHELRNPLAGIQMSLANLRQETRDELTASRLDLAIGELQRVARLLSGLLAQARHSPEPKQLVRLRPLVHDLLDLVRYQIPAEVSLHQEIADALEILAPVDSLKQALLNLVLNAAQALGTGGGSIVVQAEAQTGFLSLRVMDDGPGFPAELTSGEARAFTTSRPAGTGLGLSISRRFAREMQGEVHLTNRMPRGACAEIRLPPQSVWQKAS